MAQGFSLAEVEETSFFSLFIFSFFIKLSSVFIQNSKFCLLYVLFSLAFVNLLMMSNSGTFYSFNCASLIFRSSIFVIHYSNFIRSVGLKFCYYLDSTDEDKYVVLVSGLSIGSSKSNPLQFQLLIDHITGHLGDEKVCPVLLPKLSGR